MEDSNSIQLTNRIENVDEKNEIILTNLPNQAQQVHSISATKPKRIVSKYVIFFFYNFISFVKTKF